MHFRNFFLVSAIMLFIIGAVFLVGILDTDAVVSPDCSGLLNSCGGNDDCCSNICGGTNSVCLCADNENSCNNDIDCCSSYCAPDGVCKAPSDIDVIYCTAKFGTGYWCSSYNVWNTECAGLGLVKRLVGEICYDDIREPQSNCVTCYEPDVSQVDVTFKTWLDDLPFPGVKIELWANQEPLDSCIISANGYCSMSMNSNQEYTAVAISDNYDNVITEFTAVDGLIVFIHMDPLCNLTECKNRINQETGQASCDISPYNSSEPLLGGFKTLSCVNGTCYCYGELANVDVTFITRENNYFLSDVAIMVSGEHMSCVTNTQGFCIINMPRGGSYSIVASRDGYDSADRSITVSAGLVVNLSLDRIAKIDVTFRTWLNDLRFPGAKIELWANQEPLDSCIISANGSCSMSMNANQEYTAVAISDNYDNVITEFTATDGLIVNIHMDPLCNLTECKNRVNQETGQASCNASLNSPLLGDFKTLSCADGTCYCYGELATEDVITATLSMTPNPQQNTFFAGDSLTITLKAQDDQGVEWMQLQDRDGDWDMTYSYCGPTLTDDTPCVCDGNNVCTLSRDFTDLTSGTYEFTGYASGYYLGNIPGDRDYSNTIEVEVRQRQRLIYKTIFAKDADTRDFITGTQVEVTVFEAGGPQMGDACVTETGICTFELSFGQAYTANFSADGYNEVIGHSFFADSNDEVVKFLQKSGEPSVEGVRVYFKVFDTNRNPKDGARVTIFELGKYIGACSTDGGICHLVFSNEDHSPDLEYIAQAEFGDILRSQVQKFVPSEVVRTINLILEEIPLEMTAKVFYIRDSSTRELISGAEVTVFGGENEAGCATAEKPECRDNDPICCSVNLIKEKSYSAGITADGYESVTGYAFSTRGSAADSPVIINLKEADKSVLVTFKVIDSGENGGRAGAIVGSAKIEIYNAATGRLLNTRTAGINSGSVAVYLLPERYKVKVYHARYNDCSFQDCGIAPSAGDGIITPSEDNKIFTIKMVKIPTMKYTFVLRRGFSNFVVVSREAPLTWNEVSQKCPDTFSYFYTYSPDGGWVKTKTIPAGKTGYIPWGTGSKFSCPEKGDTKRTNGCMDACCCIFSHEVPKVVEPLFETKIFKKGSSMFMVSKILTVNKILQADCGVVRDGDGLRISAYNAGAQEQTREALYTRILESGEIAPGEPYWIMVERDCAVTW